MKKILLVVAAICIFATASAQEAGNWAVGPKLGIYSNTGGGAIAGLGVVGRYSFTDNWRLEPAIAALFHRGCSIDLNCDVQYLFNVASKWNVYPLAGLSLNQIGVWSCGINIGGGADYEVAQNWDLTASVKWMLQTARYTRNPIVISIGGTYKF